MLVFTDHDLINLRVALLRSLKAADSEQETDVFFILKAKISEEMRERSTTALLEQYKEQKKS